LNYLVIGILVLIVAFYVLKGIVKLLVEMGGEASKSLANFFGRKSKNYKAKIIKQKYHMNFCLTK
jgi:hypothetical protein